MVASFERGWGESAASGGQSPAPKRQQLPAAAEAYWGPRAERMQAAAQKSFILGVSGRVEDVISKDGEFVEFRGSGACGSALSVVRDDLVRAGGRARVVLDEQGEPVA